MAKEINLKLTITARAVIGCAAAVCLVALAKNVSTESVTLNTYYPAPSGVYNFIIATNKTFLARDGGEVNVGQATSGPGKVNVNGSVVVGTYAGGGAAAANGLLVSGSAGIGTATPQSTLDVNGNMSLGTYAGVSAAPAGGLIASGGIGVGSNNPLNAATGNPTPKSGITVSGGAGGRYIYIDNSSGCGLANTASPAANASPVCGAGLYATFTPGIYVEGYSYQNRGGPPVASIPPAGGGGTTTQVTALNTANGWSGWSTLQANLSPPGTIYCCPK